MFVNYLFNFKVCNVRYGQLIFFLQKKRNSKLVLTIRKEEEKEKECGEKRYIRGRRVEQGGGDRGKKGS